MTNEKQVAVRIPESWWEKAEALAEAVNADPAQLGRVTPTGVLREAIRRGLDVLEATRTQTKGKSAA